MCGYCRMAISQKQFAAEVLDADENAVKFDDIGCMLRYLAGVKQKPVAVFVADYSTRGWVTAGKASFVRGSKIATPMGGGILAFGDRSSAEAAARDLGGEVASFERLSNP
jgi:copper chaperone NosL